VAAQAAVAIVNARLIEQRVQAVTLERELKVAGQVQSRMLGGEPPQFDQVEIARVFSPTRTVTGDFCDFFTLCDGRVAAVVADVVGKGVPAALLGAMLRGAMRASAEACHEPGELFRRLNQHMCQETNLGEFATVVMVTISPDGRTLEYCSAGHEPVLLVRGNQVLTLEDGGLVLGVNPDERYEAHTLPVEPDDFLVLYTDGAIDALNFAQENFGRARFNAALRTYAALSTTEAVRSIEWDIRRFVGLAEQADDITLIGLRIKPVPAEVVRRTAAAPDVAATH
jgi:sigma-B regulation protein RsbU (phosphoserine phosphatase)